MDVVNSVLPNGKTARLLAAAAAGLAGAAGLYFYQKNRFRLVGHISRIVIYPVKACKGIDVVEARCEKLGLESGGAEDRRYMLVAGDNNAFVTQRQYPELALVTPSFDDDDLILNAPGMPQLRVQHYYKWEDGWTSRSIKVKKWDIFMDALDCGDEAAEWFTEYVGKRVNNKDAASSSIRDESKQGEQLRLTVYPREFGGVSAQSVLTGVDGQVVMGEDDDKVRTAKVEGTVFTDLAPYLLLNTASLNELNYQIVSHGKQPVATENFRPNFVVVPVPGQEAPYAEDTWEQIVIGDETSFHNYKPCLRCRVTVIDQSKGEFRADNEPLTTLRKTRLPQSPAGKKLLKSHPMFCSNLAPDKLGWVRVGDPVYAKIGDKFLGM